MIFYILPMLLMLSCGNQGNANASNKNVRSRKDVELIKTLQEEVAKLNRDIKTLKSNNTDSLNENVLKAEEEIRNLKAVFQLKEDELTSAMLENKKLEDEVTNLKSIIDSQADELRVTKEQADTLRAASQQNASASSQNVLEGEALEFYRNFIKIDSLNFLNVEMLEYLLSEGANWKESFNIKTFNMTVSDGLIRRSRMNYNQSRTYDLNIFEIFITFPTDEQPDEVTKLYDLVKDSLTSDLKEKSRAALYKLNVNVRSGDQLTIDFNDRSSMFAIIRQICSDMNIIN